jgi:glycosyltransferase involved in cell wall biosynthesis
LSDEPTERSAAAALLLARLHGEPVSVTDPCTTTGRLWEALQLHRLVPEEGRRGRTSTRNGEPGASAPGERRTAAPPGADAPGSPALRLRVLVLSNLYAPDFMGGYELGCRQAAEALVAAGHDVLVLTSAPRIPGRLAPGDGKVAVRRALHLADVYTPYLQEGVSPLTLCLRHAAANLVQAFNVHVLLEVLEVFSPQVVYLWNLVGLGGLGLVACLHHRGVPWVWHLMDRVPRDLCNLPFIPDVAGPLASAAAPLMAGQFLACSRRVAEETERHAPLLQAGVELVPNWVTQKPLPRRRWYRPGGRLRIATAAGRLGAEKGTDRLLYAAALLRRGGHDNFLIDLNGLVDGDELPRLVREEGLEGHVRFRGLRPTEELTRLYAGCDVFAFPTWTREPFGFAPLEAAAQGCVPLITDDCGIGEWLVDGVHCLKASRTAEAFAGVLADVLDGRIDLRPLGRRASAVVGRDFHLRRVLPAIEAALRRAAGQRRTPLGPPAEAYHLAVLGEKLAEAHVQDLMAG